MRIYRCQECEVPVSRYCRKCPNCCARNPTFKRRSPWAMFILVLMLGCVVFLIKNVK